MFRLLGTRNPRKALREALGEFTLPSFPAITMRALELIRKDGVSAGEVADVLVLDPGLSVRLLAAVNSAAFAPARVIDDLRQAVAMLGMSNLETLVMAVAVKGALPAPSCPGFEPDRFWRAAARRSALAQKLADILHPASRSHCLTAALLQDMAVPLLAAHRTRAYGPVLEAWHAGEGELVELEQKALGFDHAQVATWLCHEWKLPESLSQAIGNHHAEPGSAGMSPALSLVARLGELEGAGIDDLVRLADEDHGLSPVAVHEAIARSVAAADELAGLLA